MRLAVACMFVLGASIAHAQPRAMPPASGLYESWSPVTLAPAGSLAAAPSALPQWLSVVSQGASVVVTFEPERRVTWRTTWGAHGIVEKLTEVDGEVFSRSRFTYDASGHLSRKEVDGAGILRGPWRFDYRTDASGRVLERSAQLPRRMAWGSRNLVYPDLTERVVYGYSARGVVCTTEREGRAVREDVLDPAGRLLSTRFGDLSRPRRGTALVYARDRAGVLVRIDRVRLGARAAAHASARDAGLSSLELVALVAAPPLRTSTQALPTSVPLERWEAQLVLGAPVHERLEGRGASTHITDDWSEGCWLNATSSIEFDATGYIVASAAGCICGFCVDAALPWTGDAVEGIDLHRTAGPWVRLDDAVDVTADHRVMTPTGPRAAGELRAGDTVLRDDGGTRVLTRVEALPRGAERLGRNVRTRSGTFAAGGFLFESEPARECNAPH